MSPRRMDISSLLRDDDPPQPRPRSIDALLHPHPRPPFLGLDALVHVASEEHRRIAADRDADRPHNVLPHSRPDPLPSPTSRHYPPASPINNYPTLRRHSILHMDSPRPALDARPLPHSPSLQHMHSPSPRNNSPQRHSPHHPRSLHHSSPISASPETDLVSPRSTHGPRMAGGIDVLFSDSSSTPRLDMSQFQPSAYDRFPSDPRHEHPKLSPLSAHPLSSDDERYQPKVLVEAQESILLRDRIRPRLHSDLHGTNVSIHSWEAGPLAQPHERHPIRVWEEQPVIRETSRYRSPAYRPSITSDTTDVHGWAGIGESAYTKRSARETDISSDDVSIRHEDPRPCRAPTPDHVVLRTPIEGTRLDPGCTGVCEAGWGPSAMSGQHLPPSLPISPSPHTADSPVLDTHLTHLESQPGPQLERSRVQVDASTSALLISPDAIAKESSLGKAEMIPEAMDVVMVNPLPTEVIPAIPPLDEPQKPVALAQANVSQSPHRGPSVLLPAKDEHDMPLRDVSIFQDVRPEPPPCPSPNPEHPCERERLVPEQAMMDVDEELLSLVEDRPVRTVFAASKAPPDLSETLDGPSSLLSSQLAPKSPPVRADEEKDRVSMPPPAARSKKAEMDKTNVTAGSATGSKKKKDGAIKPAAKPKQPPKPRIRPTPKPKIKPNIADTPIKGSIPKGVANANSRSRSASVIPGTVDDAAPEPEPDESDKEDDRLYCICKTRYDEDRMMIACDRCDEWFHTLCVNMPDLEIELVDQFICPPCIQKHPHLRTTWKRRCLFGFQHRNPSSPDACHKPSRGAFSKYCSDECGIKYMRAHIAQWEKSGGARDSLWESVKDAAKREGVVVRVETNITSLPKTVDLDSEPKLVDSAAKRRAEREVTCLNARLEQVVKEREFMKRELDMITWREKVVGLASERASKLDECGWDQRLCFGKEEWVDFGSEVLESYDEERAKAEDAMPLDATPALHGEWWCTGKKKCERHAGWQKLRTAEVSFDKETKEGILLKLTTREREIRKRIEDILSPQPTGTLQPASHELNGFE